MSLRSILIFVALLPVGGALGWAMAWWERQPSFDSRLPIVMLPLLVMLSSAAGTIALRGRRLVRPSGRVALRRSPGRFPGLSRLVLQVGLLSLLGVALARDGITLESLGVSADVHPLAAFAGGALVYGAFLYVSNRTIRWLDIEDELDDLAMQAHALVVPRGRSDKVASWIAVVLLNPIMEEALFRGVLVHHLGVVTGHVAPALALGLVANGLNHLYQGARIQGFHLGVYVCAVALLYSPLGLVGAIGFHFGGDLVPMLAVRRELRRYRLRHSAGRAPA